MRVVVIGGGAAGFFAALSVRDHHPGAEIILLERSDKLLAKVRISGGASCGARMRTGWGSKVNTPGRPPNCRT